jgi:ATP-dependent Clp protease ATP-binding subunit ClpB
MNLNNYTIKAQEAIMKSLEIASANNQQAVSDLHILKGILSVDENVAPFLLKKLGVNVAHVTSLLDTEIERQPRSNGTPYLANDAQQILLKASGFLKEFHDEFVTIEILLLSLLAQNSKAASLLKSEGVTEKDIKAAINDMRKGSSAKSASAEETYQALGKYAKNLNDLARKGKLDPVIGRDDEIRRVLQILSRRTKNNPILIGEPGVGKTAIAEGLAQRIIEGDVPEDLKTKQLYSIDMGALIDGA